MRRRLLIIGCYLAAIACVIAFNYSYNTDDILSYIREWQSSGSRPEVLPNSIFTCLILLSLIIVFIDTIIGDVIAAIVNSILVGIDLIQDCGCILLYRQLNMLRVCSITLILLSFTTHLLGFTCSFLGIKIWVLIELYTLFQVYTIIDSFASRRALMTLIAEEGEVVEDA